jgi:hypothetical protein
MSDRWGITKEDEEFLNAQLEPLYKRTVEAIRKVDKNHIIMLGGAQWNSRFNMFSDWKFDSNIMYTCHRYGGPATANAIRGFIQFRDSTQLPMYMGEIGHNSNQWIHDFSKVMEENNIGYTFWPYKKMGDSTAFVHVKTPENWEMIRTYMETLRFGYSDIYAARKKIQLDTVRKALNDYLENILFENTRVNDAYIRAMLLHAEPN